METPYIRAGITAGPNISALQVLLLERVLGHLLPGVFNELGFHVPEGDVVFNAISADADGPVKIHIGYRIIGRDVKHPNRDVVGRQVLIGLSQLLEHTSGLLPEIDLGVVVELLSAEQMRQFEDFFLEEDFADIEVTAADAEIRFESLDQAVTSAVDAVLSAYASTA